MPTLNGLKDAVERHWPPQLLISFLPSMCRRILEATAVALLLFAQTSTTHAVPANITRRDPTYGFPYGSTTIRGVNLGILYWGQILSQLQGVARA
jgi:hypothetical protein